MKLLLLIPLAKLIVDDFRRREVLAAWLAVLGVMAAGSAGWVDGWREAAVNCGLNLLLLVYMGAGVAAWAWLRRRKIASLIGLGDVLFFAALTPVFPLRTFLWLIVGSMVFSLAWWRSPRNVPLAATSGVVMGAAIIIGTLIK